MLQIELTEAQVRVILKALIICGNEMEASAMDSKSATNREYYERKRDEYYNAERAVHSAYSEQL